MTVKPAVWHPISIALSAINLVGLGLAAGATEPLHAGVHAVLALAFGAGAWRLRRGPGGLDELAGLNAVDAEIESLRQELIETQERLDFAERVLAQRVEVPRVETSDAYPPGALQPPAKDPP